MEKQHFNQGVYMTDEVVREIVDVFLVKCERGVLALCSEQESKGYITLGKEKNLKVTTQKITTNLNRANEIGKNLFKVNFPYSSKSELIEFRNTVIKDWMTRCANIKKSNPQLVWDKVATKYKLSISTPEEFSQSVLDKIEYA
jgi:hypothetical protein